MQKYRVNEIFKSLQGEGTYTGLPMVFVRFSGCNKWSGRDEHKAKSICSFCDTNFLPYDEMTLDDIMTAVGDLDCEDVCLSGGEPTLQMDIALMDKLSKYRIHVETNGSKDISAFEDYIFHISTSPKQPLSETKLGRADDLKFLHPPIHPEITPEAFKGYSGRIFIQPLEDANWETNRMESIALCLKKNYSLSNQMHKTLNMR